MADKRQLKAGKLRHTVLIQQNRSTTKDAFGQPIPSWATIRTGAASIDPISGRELWQGNQVHPDVTHGIEMRAGFLTITPDMRILFGPGTWLGGDLTVAQPAGCRVFEIMLVLNVEEQGRKLLIQAREQVA